MNKQNLAREFFDFKKKNSNTFTVIMSLMSNYVTPKDFMHNI